MKERMKKVAAIIPARNEEGSIGRIVEMLKSVNHPRCTLHEILVVNNGSIDRTREIARESGATVVDEEIPGYGRACLSGVAAVSREVDIFLFLDADGSDNPLLWPQLVDPIFEQGAEMVVGKRIFPSDTDSHPIHARFGTWLITSLIKVLFSSPLSDLGPYRAIVADSFRKLGMKNTGCGWTVEMQIRAVQCGLISYEVPVVHEKRLTGESKISGTVGGTVRAASAMFAMIIKECVKSIFKVQSNSNPAFGSQKRKSL
ncbi:glycosyltransferase family 2 protein [bacterium]|nr:glycosyltransferase family 2 protein [bacterium]